MNKLTIIIPTFNRSRDVLEMIVSIKKSDFTDYQIAVIDDGSIEDVADKVKEKFSDVKILRNEKNLGAAASRNTGIKKFKNESEFLLFLDSDETVAPDCIGLLVRALKANEKIGAVTASVYYYDKPEVKQYGESWVGLYSGINYSGNKNPSLAAREVRMCGGNFMIRSSAVDQVGLFDETYRTFYEDADYSLRIREAGCKLVYAPRAKVYHKTSLLDKKEGSSKWLAHAYLTARNKIIFMKKHGKCFFVFCLFYPAYFLFYIYKALRFKNFKAVREYLRGIRDGFAWQIKK